MYVVNLLSRSYLKDQVADDTEIDQMVQCVSTHLVITPCRSVQFEKETSTDTELTLLKKYHILGWSGHKKQANQIVHSYWPTKHDIFSEENLLFYKNRVIVPTKLRPKMLSPVHEGHGAVGRCLARAGSVICWPGWARDVEMYVKQCKSCEKYAPRNKKHEYYSRDIPTLPYEHVSAFGGKKFLIITDAYSKWVNIFPLQGKNVESVVDTCTTVFAVHGDSQVLVSDNIPFNSREFRNFAKDRFELQFSSPRYAQSNGLAEKGVHSFYAKVGKQILTIGRLCENIITLPYQGLEFLHLNY
ncbi:hypothetical protein PR048_008745 [Dryococelus australis]|uniref:RNA-directed DNA polymerase n=1 Tax=Dryococelus australis TaxID=614101 RepID=A0ABQ9HXZ4_9NEOP|nr:hypothetical protein PR048_008745 [Dryococelus australis]